MTGFPYRDLSLQFVQPTQLALRDCFEIMLGVGIEFVAADRFSQVEKQDTISAAIRLTGDVQGLILFYYPPQTALAITRRILGMEKVSVSLVHDCMGEVANVVGGGAKSLMPQFQLNLGLPVVPWSPEKNPTVTDNVPRQWLSARSETGHFLVGLSLLAERKLTAREVAKELEQKELANIDGTETNSNNKIHFSPTSARRQVSSGS